MQHWTFRDFIDSRGNNVIHIWLGGQPVRARAKINARLLLLAGARFLREPYAKKLSGECEGLIELRIEFRMVQYRPLACYEPRDGDITLLLGAFERNNRLDPPSACATARARMRLIHDKDRTCEHKFD